MKDPNFGQLLRRVLKNWVNLHFESVLRKYYEAFPHSKTNGIGAKKVFPKLIENGKCLKLLREYFVDHVVPCVGAEIEPYFPVFESFLESAFEEYFKAHKMRELNKQNEALSKSVPGGVQEGTCFFSIFFVCSTFAFARCN